MKGLLELAKNPMPFEEGTQEIWLDPDRAELVLKTHLDENIPGGSKSTEFIHETIQFIKNIAPPESYKRVIDLGCGPGLYSQGLAKSGYKVVGVDFNRNSINYAIEEAKKNNLLIDYLYGDMTKLNFQNEFDIALLIYELYGSFDQTKRKKILNNIYKGLKPDGLVLLDVLSDNSYEKFEQNLLWGLSANDLFSQKEHLTLFASLKYPNKVSLVKNILAFDNGDLVNYNYWNQYFSIPDLEKEVTEAGFIIEKVYADVNGGEYEENSDCFAVVLRKK